MVPDTKGSKKTRDMLVGFPIFASQINKKLIEGILKSDKKDETNIAARDLDLNQMAVQDYDYSSNLDFTIANTDNERSLEKQGYHKNTIPVKHRL